MNFLVRLDLPVGMQLWAGGFPGQAVEQFCGIFFQVSGAHVFVRLGEKGHRIDHFAEYDRGGLVQEQQEPAAHRVDCVGAPAGIERHLDICREHDFGSENLGEVLHKGARLGAVVTRVAGAFCHDELASPDLANLRFDEDGLVVELPKSKTNQQGEAKEKAIFFSPDRRSCTGGKGLVVRAGTAPGHCGPVVSLTRESA